MNKPIQSAHQEMLQRAVYHPIFDEDRNLVAISQLKVETDTRIGKQAMLELLKEEHPGDHLVCPTTGMTGKQTRILSRPAPMEAHHLKHSQKYDPALGGLRDGVTIILQGEVVWTLFEHLFQNQYSLRVTDITCDSEDVMPVGPDHIGKQPDNQPGRIFFARAQVEIVLHLANGQSRTYTGVGISFDHVRMARMGNTGAINNARRMAEKGAVTDAKREALANIGQVFRRAFEDGDEMIEKFEDMLLEQLTTRNRRPVSAVAATSSPAPRADTSEAPADIENNMPTAVQQAAIEDGPQFSPADEEEDGLPDFDLPPQTAAGGEPQVDGKKTTPANKEPSADEEKQGAGEPEGETSEKGAEKAPVEVAPKEPEPAPNWKIDHAEMKPKQILEAYRELFSRAASTSDLDAILDANRNAARRLRGKTMMEMVEAKMARETELNA